MNKFYLLILLIAAFISACTPTTVEQKYKGMTSEQIFNLGEKSLNKKKYDQASKHFEALQTLFPFGPNAEQAQMDIIYTYYKNNDPASAIAAADRYIHLYPQGKDVDYAYYMKGLVNFERGQTKI
jgi:outer membrane protein assembly factor BamD